jgi:hypothetical protein
MRAIETNGSDIFIMDRPHGGLTVQQGRSRLLLTPAEAQELAAALLEELEEITE